MTDEKKLLEVGQKVKFMPSVSNRVRTLLDATVTKVWGPGCVNVTVGYPDCTTEETSVLVCLPHQQRPSGGYYVVPL